MFAASITSKAQEGLLLREITHRVNNEFASIIQVVSRTAAKSPDGNVKLALAGIAQQLHCYARVHHALQMPENLAAKIEHNHLSSPLHEIGLQVFE